MCFGFCALLCVSRGFKDVSKLELPVSVCSYSSCDSWLVRFSPSKIRSTKHTNYTDEDEEQILEFSHTLQAGGKVLIVLTVFDCDNLESPRFQVVEAALDQANR